MHIFKITSSTAVIQWQQNSVYVEKKKTVNGLCMPTSPLPISSWVHPSLASEGIIDRKNVETAHLHMIWRISRTKWHQSPRNVVFLHESQENTNGASVSYGQSNLRPFAVTSLPLAQVSHCCTDHLPLFKVFWLIKLSRKKRKKVTHTKKRS